MLYGIASLLAALATTLCMVGYVPPYSWFADLQLGLFGSHIAAVSFIAALLVVITPLGIVARLLYRPGLSA